MCAFLFIHAIIGGSQPIQHQRASLWRTKNMVFNRSGALAITRSISSRRVSRGFQGVLELGST